MDKEDYDPTVAKVTDGVRTAGRLSQKPSLCSVPLWHSELLNFWELKIMEIYCYSRPAPRDLITGLFQFKIKNEGRDWRKVSLVPKANSTLETFSEFH